MTSNIGFLRLKSLLEKGYEPNLRTSYGSAIQLVHPLAFFITIDADGTIWQAKNNYNISPTETEKFNDFIASIRKPNLFHRIEFSLKLKVILSIYVVTALIGIVLDVLWYYIFKASSNFFDSFFQLPPFALWWRFSFPLPGGASKYIWSYAQKTVALQENFKASHQVGWQKVPKGTKKQQLAWVQALIRARRMPFRLTWRSRSGFGWI